MNNQCIQLSIDHFPFKTSLSLAPIIHYWKGRTEDENAMIAAIAKKIDTTLSHTPELLQPVTEENTIVKHKHLVELLMSAVFPAANPDKEMSGAFTPFENYCFYYTPAWRAKVLKYTSQIHYPENLKASMILYYKIFYTYILILRRHYNKEISHEMSIPFIFKDEQTGLDKYYKMVVNTSFTEVKKRGDLPLLTQEVWQLLLHNFFDMDLWMQYLPPQNFELEGFVMLSFIDITEAEILSALKLNLLDRESIFSTRKFNLLQSHLQTLLNKNDIALGISGFQKTRNKFVTFGHNLDQLSTRNPSEDTTCPASLHVFYQQLLEQKISVFIEDVKLFSLPPAIEARLTAKGIQSIVFIPLYVEEETIGIFELSSPHAHDLNAISLGIIDGMLPLFALAITWYFEQEENRIEAIIKEKFTAIHPAVEWRFKQAALNLFDQQQKGGKAEIEPIVFQEVFPLYGASDIRNSSVERNRAIGQDLMAQLQLVKAVMEQVILQKPFPIYVKLIHKLDKFRSNLKSGLLADAEISIHEFLKREIEPVFRHIIIALPQLKQDIEAYQAVLDLELGVLYEKRKAFEESLMLINETLSHYLEEEEQNAQQMFPHYFEKYKTDGIEYNIYLGASLVNQAFDSIYLKNLRLWQLLTMCEMAKRTKALQPKLKIPLETTQLILVHSQPLSICFRMDERHFDVDGAYNIRYEILKKRIDKALIKGTNERLTQPGKIVIIYSQFKEAMEYNDYIEYLQERKLVTGAVERLELEDLQVVQGLKALWVEVDYQEKETLKKKVAKEAGNLHLREDTYAS